MEFIPGFSQERSSRGALWLFFSEKESLIASASGNAAPFWEGDAQLPLRRSFFIGSLGSRDIFCGEPETDRLPEGLEWVPFRDLYRSLDRGDQFPVSRGKQLLTWDRTHRFCGVCAAETVLSEQEHSRSCPACGELFYPRLSPAVITRITRGNRILLAHNTHFPEGVYSHIAGFVEAGESLEQTVRREIREEVGLEVENIRYFGSQPWPLPHSLMLAFTAECPSGDPVPDGVEIQDARWFEKDQLPGFPSPGSIAMKLLEDFLKS